VKSAILQKGEHFYTHMSKIFNAIGNGQLKYNWLITDYECYPQDKGINEVFSTEYIWMAGKQLTEIIRREDFQFIWGVFSGFSLEVTLEEVLKYDLPFADGYKGFWANDVGIQHPLAEVEIVAWDSSLTLLIGRDYNLVQKFRRNLPLSEDLSALNKQNNRQR